MTPPLAQPSDGDLIARFCDAEAPGIRDAAFAEIVTRHAAMVLGACRRVAGDGPDAEDAAQAVFQVLAHKAKALRDHPTLGGWLHRVARNVAMRQRQALRTRQRHEQEAGTMTPATPNFDDRLRGELREELDGALDALGERYRMPLVLHYLEGHSQEEVAQLLNLNPGTLASLLSRGRELLRHQLARKGIAVSAVALAALLAGEAQAAVPAAFVAAATTAATATTAAAASAAGGAVASKTTVLTQGALKAMAAAKLKAAAIIAAATLTVGAGVVGGTIALRAPTAASDSAPAAAPSTPEPIVVPEIAAPKPVAVPVRVDGPEIAVLEVARALRENDLISLYARLPADQRELADRAWRESPSRPHGGPPHGANGANGPDRLLSLAASGDAADQIAAAVAPVAAQLQPQVLAAMAQGITARFLVDGLNATAGNDPLARAQAAAFTALAADFTAWLGTAGFADPDKLRTASACLVDALRDLQAASTDELRELSLNDLLGRSGHSLASLKRLLAVYDCRIDAMLDSLAVAAGPVNGDRCLLTVSFTAFAKRQQVPVLVERREGRWQFADVAAQNGSWMPWRRFPRDRGPGRRDSDQDRHDRDAAPAPTPVPAKPSQTWEF